jgi:hypothetical protein
MTDRPYETEEDDDMGFETDDTAPAFTLGFAPGDRPVLLLADTSPAHPPTILRCDPEHPAMLATRYRALTD